MADPFPLRIRKLSEGLSVAWDDGVETVLGFRALRLSCPCARCVHEVTGERILRDEDVPEDVEVVDLQPQGRYAYRILFSDGHDSGIWTLERLHALCREAAATGDGRDDP